MNSWAQLVETPSTFILPTNNELQGNFPDFARALTGRTRVRGEFMGRVGISYFQLHTRYMH